MNCTFFFFFFLLRLLLNIRAWYIFLGGKRQKYSHTHTLRTQRSSWCVRPSAQRKLRAAATTVVIRSQQLLYNIKPVLGEERSEVRQGRDRAGNWVLLIFFFFTMNKVWAFETGGWGSSSQIWFSVMGALQQTSTPAEDTEVFWRAGGWRSAEPKPQCCSEFELELFSGSVYTVAGYSASLPRLLTSRAL